MHQGSTGQFLKRIDLPPTPSTPHWIDRRNDVGYSPRIPQINQSRFIKGSVSVGLRTPPEDDMHSAYQNYKSRPDENFPEPVNIGRKDNYDGSAMQSRKPSPVPQASGAPAPRISNVNREVPFVWPSVKEENQAGTFHSTASTTLESESTRKPQAKNSIMHPNLKIPESIGDGYGNSLHEFAAQITCLFWFESTEKLQRVENWWMESMEIEPLRAEAVPSPGFKKWVGAILTTTQVSRNVILLALLFIYRLKSFNPAVKGRSGSEYRLLTVALMLGNKFLDDNTYTNKTWAEVSGISVTEIHTMEVEFLSNMRYSLLTSEDDWTGWHQKLRIFNNFCHRTIDLLPPLPSPSTQSSQYISVLGPYNLTPQWPAINNAVQLASPLTTVSNASDQDFLPNARKRSFTKDVEEPVAKRVSRSTTSIHSVPGNLNMAVRPRLPPVTNLTISTGQAINGYNGPTTFSHNAPLLPPLNGTRAMSSVYPTTPTYPPPILNHTPTGSQSSGPPATTPYQHDNQNFVTPSRQRSPYSAVQEPLSSVPSPLNSSFSGSSGHISPSVFYQQRNSPYKPIRHVNTLLCPPPSASMHDYAVNTDCIHYQPLGKRHDYRSGVVPDYGHQPLNPWYVLPQPKCPPE
ncbi:hypothetical protein NHQ30_001953 [Ciborinia camelliae]|nr:hypothetical protein NHQ30_001953 [Ciborinia camelliae]